MEQTIKQRARIHAISKSRSTLNRFRDIEVAYIEGAETQDRIARQEERERCINAAKKACCYVCKHIEMNSGCFIDPTTKECSKIEHIRKAMEGGSNGK